MLPFDFPELLKTDLSGRYLKFAYPDRRNPLFRFDMIIPKDWMAILILEPEGIPDDGSVVEVGVFHRYAVPADQKSEILAGIYVLAARVPSKWTDAETIDALAKKWFPSHDLNILKEQTYEFPNKKLKDLLFSYKDTQGDVFYSRLTGFKVKDENRKYFVGEKDIVYLIQLNTSEKYYSEFAAEAFYIAKVTLNLT